MKTIKNKSLLLLTLAFFFSIYFNAQTSTISNLTSGNQNFSNASVTNDGVLSFIKNSKEHTTLYKLILAVNLDKTLVKDASFTVFAPTDTAFKKLPEGTLETLLKPENIETLKTVLLYHIITGNFDTITIKNNVEINGGTARFKTANGEAFSVSLNADNLAITGNKGNKAKVTTADINKSNGIVHVIDNVLLP